MTKVKIISAAQVIDAALGSGTSRKRPELVGLVLIANQLRALRESLRPRTPRSEFEVVHEQPVIQLEKAVMRAWLASVGGAAVTAREVLDRVNAPTGISPEYAALGAALRDLFEKSMRDLNPRALGIWLELNGKRMFCGHHFARGRSRDHVNVYAAREAKTANS